MPSAIAIDLELLRDLTGRDGPEPVFLAPRVRIVSRIL